MKSGKPGSITGFIKGFVVATALCGAGAVFALGELYTPNPEGDWIRDAGKYAPGSNDQANVLGDLQPGAAEIMFNVGLRLNVLNTAGKKQNWDLATFEAEEIEEAFGRLMITRPLLTTDLENFLTTKLEPVITAATAATPDSAAFKTALANTADACTACHVLYGEDHLVVKLGKSALPLE